MNTLPAPRAAVNVATPPLLLPVSSVLQPTRTHKRRGYVWIPLPRRDTHAMPVPDPWSRVRLLRANNPKLVTWASALNFVGSTATV